MDEVMVEIIKEFLHDGYSITKVRKESKFKRGIVIDVNTVVYMLSNERSAIRKMVFNSLKDVFPVTDDVIVEAMKGYLIGERKSKPTKRRPYQIPR